MIENVILDSSMCPICKKIILINDGVYYVQNPLMVYCYCFHEKCFERSGVKWLHSRFKHKCRRTRWY
jgi:hypothetical protein